MKSNADKTIEKPCACEVHVRLEASDGKDHLPCLGHGIGCPCTEKLQAVEKAPENAENTAEVKQTA